MPFPIELKYIEDLEKELNILFPSKFKSKMQKENGGEIEFNGEYFDLYPFFDKSDKQRISRTCNHIGMETKNAREYPNFPSNFITIGSDGSGNQLVLTHNGDNRLLENIHYWDHETGEVKELTQTING